ncbi:uncharacterized protein KIAA0513-like isoform X1 [Eriocheir sinensis]|uniref:uncharacterized protein KIAA0513-like isoform X1 n=1 Tax=Eriocheir sinensis TaxID=95602 RepID=UPI0021C953C8|nr:uncharacterized protein KIAA0513-like isoform X1 [Eriocheir sinensis]
MTATTNGAGGGYLRTRLRSALHTSNDLLSGLSSNISSRLSVFSVASGNSNASSERSPPPPPIPAVPEKPPSTPPLQLPPSPEESHRSPTMKEMIKETFKLENLRELRPTLEELMQSESSSEPSTLPTNTPDSPKTGFRFHLNNFNQAIPKKLVDYKQLAIRTLSGEAGEGSPGAANGVKPCAINVECVDEKREDGVDETKDVVEGASTGLSSRSFNSMHSLYATGPDPYDKLKYKPDIISSGTPSDGEGLGHSTSMDSTDSDPHKKLWIRSVGSQTSLQSWASSLSYDSQAEDFNEPKEFMRKFVEEVFKMPHVINIDRKARFGELAQTEQGRLWFARCINAKRCCKCVSEASFFSLIQHFSVMLFECNEAEDFSPAKSLMNMCFTYYHEAHTPGGQNRTKEFLYSYLRQQPIWRSIRFWNAAFFDALQCERSLRPVVTREEVESNRLQAVTDELHYQENITFGQLGTFTCNMHAFGLSKEMVNEFLRKQVTIASLRPDQVKLLRENVERMYSGKQEWQ